MQELFGINLSFFSLISKYEKHDYRYALQNNSKQ